jgi:prephenate dehydrogenase
MKLGIVGLGLMGGSIALALRKWNKIDKIVGFDHTPEHQQIAIERKIVDSTEDISTLVKCDIVILAIPVDGIVSLLHSLPELSTKTTLIDLGSTKEKIIQAIPSHLVGQFVPAHPMTGTEFSGPNAAFETLYENKTVVLCDQHNIDDHHLKIGKDLFEFLKMKIVLMNSNDHDRHASFISHLPHILSYALANTVLSQEDKGSILTLAAGGFKDMSRLAKSSPAMWRDIFHQNKKNLLSSMDVFKNEINEAQKYVEEEDWEKLMLWMKEANSLHTII